MKCPTCYNEMEKDHYDELKNLFWRCPSCGKEWSIETIVESLVINMMGD